jgi:CO/xanthine dehydrogenase FAD-binding subunit
MPRVVDEAGALHPCEGNRNGALSGRHGVRELPVLRLHQIAKRFGGGMNSLRYEAPSSLADAVALLARTSGPSCILAGGTDVIVQMETDLIEPELLVDIKKIAELRQIIVENGGAFRVGAAVTGMELLEHRGFCKAWPGVVDGVKLIGSMQIKGRATMGGNLCNASPAADSVPALIAAGAIARVAGPSGVRDVPVEDIPTGPGKTSLGRGEIVVSFLFPPRPRRTGDAYLRMTPRTEMDIAVVGVGINIALDADGTCTAARVALGAVAPTPLLVAEAGAALVGSRIDGAELERLAEAARAACRPIDDKRGTIDYRITVAGVLAKRAATAALERARQNG